MPDCFGSNSLEDRLSQSQDRNNQRFTSFGNDLADLTRKLALLTEQLAKTQTQVEHLQALEDATLTRNKHRASEVFRKLGKQMGIIKPDVYMFELWLDHVRNTRTDRLVRRATAAEREAMENRCFMLQQQLDTRHLEIQQHQNKISDLQQSLEECVARPTNETVIHKMVTLDNRFKQTEENNKQFLAMIDSLATNVAQTIDRLSTSHTDRINWVIGNFATQLKHRNFRFASAEFSLGGIPGFRMTLEISGASEAAAPLPGSLSVKISCRTENTAELQLELYDKKSKFSYTFNKQNPEISFSDMSTVSRAYDARADSVTVRLSLVSLVSKIPVAGGEGLTLADMQVTASSSNSVQAVRSIVAQEISALQESMASVAEWRIESARSLCSRHTEFFSSPFRLQSLARLVVSLTVDKLDETVSVRLVVNQSGVKALKFSVSVGSHTRILEVANNTAERLVLEKRKFCKVMPEIENITDSLLVVLRVVDLQMYTGSSGNAIQLKTFRTAITEDRENGGAVPRPIFVPPLNESTVYDAALDGVDKEDERITDLQLHKLSFLFCVY